MLAGLAASRADAVALGLSAGLLLLHQLYYARLIGFDAVDDAYISFRYALNWVQGFGPVFNPGERVEGYTNFLWVAILRGLADLGISIPPASLVLGALLALATLATLWKVSRGDAENAVPVAPFLLAADGSFVLWSVSGLETALFGFLLLVGAVSFRRELARGGFPFSGLLFALAAMARPEGVLVFGVSLAYQVIYRALTWPRRAGPGDGGLAAGGKPAHTLWPCARTDAGRLLLFAGLYGLYFLWRFRYYGFLLPNTFYAKVETASPDAQVARGFAHLGTFLGVHYGPVMPILIALAFLPDALWRRGHRQDGFGARHVPRSDLQADRVWQSYSALLVAVYCAYIVYVGGDWSIGRFFAPVLPFAYFLAAEGLASLLRLALRALRSPRPGLPATAMLLLAMALSLANAYRSSYRGERELYALPFEVRLASQARRAAGEWLRYHAPPDALLLVDAAGQMPYYSGLRAIDLFGLTDPYVAHQRIAIGKGTAGHEKVDLDYLFAQEPDYVVIYGRAFDGFGQYARVEDWTADPGFARFLSIYRRR